MCNLDKKLINAHIIPKSFFKGIRNKGLRLLSMHSNQCKRLPKGVYDKNILCYECEQTFQKCDNYATHLFSNEKYEFYPDVYGGVLKYIKYDYDLLKKFFLSVVYRAHLSQCETYENIDLGGIANKIKDIILCPEAVGKNTFPCIVIHYTGEFSNIIIAPYYDEENNCYRFYLGQFGFLIRLDGEMLTPLWEQNAIAPASPLYVNSIPFAMSREFEMVKMFYNRQ